MSFMVPSIIAPPPCPAYPPLSSSPCLSSRQVDWDGKVALIQTAQAMGIQRFIFFSIHECEKHPEVREGRQVLGREGDGQCRAGQSEGWKCLNEQYQRGVCETQVSVVPTDRCRILSYS